MKTTWKEKFKKYGLFFFSLGLILFVSIINRFPDGYVFAGGDTFQYINYSKMFAHLSHAWSDFKGEGYALQSYSYSIYHSVFYLLYLMKVNILFNSMLFYLIYLGGSFLSFFYASKCFFKEKTVSVNYRVIFSLLYSLNLFTFSFFYAKWWFSPIISLYILIPLIFGLTYRFFLDEEINKKVLAGIGIMIFFSNISFGNIAFFISLNIFLLLFILLIKMFYKTSIFLKKVIIYYGLFFLSSFWVTIPQFSTLIKVSQQANYGESIFDLGRWIISNASRFPNPLFIINYTSLYSDISKVFLLSVLFFIFVIIASIVKRNKTILIFNVLILVDLFLMNKGAGWLNNESILTIFLSNSILASLRSLDKTIIFLIYFLIIILFIGFKDFFNKNNINKAISYTILFILMIAIYPIFTGGMQTKYSNSFLKGENYKNAEYSYLVKIPEEYENNVLNSKDTLSDSKILSMPYSVINSMGWENYPKWKLVGFDTTQQFFNKPIMQMNTVGTIFGTWNYGKFWNGLESIQSKWIIPLSGILNAKYFIYHKDVAENFLQQTIDKIKYYEENSMISKIDDNSYFNIYKIKDEYFLPHFYTPRSVIVSFELIEKLPEIVSQENYQISSAIYFESQNKDNALIKKLADEQNREKEKEENIAKIESEIKDIENVIASLGKPKTEWQQQILTDHNNKLEKLNTDLAEEQNSLQELMATKISVLPRLEFKKINPTKYRVIVHNAQGEFPLIFSESFNDGWKIYLAKKPERHINQNIDSYKILEGNEEGQASLGELKQFIYERLITNLGNGKEKEIKHIKWDNNKEKLDYVEKYKIDFISKKFQGTIQNNNLPSGDFYETWFKDPVDNNVNHLMVNGYANSWVVNTDNVCQNNDNCIKNSDGSYDFEVVIEFWPQRLFHIGLVVSGTTLLLSAIYLIFSPKRGKIKKSKRLTSAKR